MRSTAGGATGGATSRAATSVAATTRLVLANIENITVFGLLAWVAAGKVVDFAELQTWATFDAGGKIAGVTTTTTAGGTTTTARGTTRITTSRTTLRVI